MEKDRVKNLVWGDVVMYGGKEVRLISFTSTCAVFRGNDPITAQYQTYRIPKNSMQWIEVVKKYNPNEVDKNNPTHSRRIGNFKVNSRRIGDRQ